MASISVRVEADRLILSYHHRSIGGEWMDAQYPVRLDLTPCTYGGHRARFICAAQACGRRGAILYGGGMFACRHCHRLAYPSQRESADNRALRKADRIRARLGRVPGVLHGEGGKPKWMRWQTFERLMSEHEAYAAESLLGTAKRLAILKRLMK